MSAGDKVKAKVTATADPLMVGNSQATPAPLSRVLLFVLKALR
jgi:hypothetical protein